MVKINIWDIAGFIIQDKIEQQVYPNYIENNQQAQQLYLIYYKKKHYKGKYNKFILMEVKN